MSQDVYYKYQGLSQLKHFLDLVYKSRLYGATRKQLNDPMEGKFDYTHLKSEDFEEIYRAFKSARICSMQQSQKDQSAPTDFLMWSHYADEHKGCCIAFTIPTGKQKNKHWTLQPVVYSDTLPPVVGKLDEKIRTILSYKSTVWKHEREARAIYFNPESNNTKEHFFSINIQAIYLGARIGMEDCRLYKKLIQSLNPDIKVFKMEEHRQDRIHFASLSAREIHMK